MDRLFLLVFLFSMTSAASQRPDPELVAALESKPARVHRSPATAIANTEGGFDIIQAPAPETVGAADTSLSYRYKPTTHEKRMSLVLPSVVVHGFPIDKEVADQMPRKLDGGQTVVTPGAGLQYVSPGGFLVIGGLLKDCYDNLAGLFQIGQQFKLFGRTTIGYSLGIYARETPIACRTTTSRFGRTTTTCDEFDNYQFKSMTQVSGESVDIIPMPFLHFTTPVIRTSEFELDFKIMSNFALNEFGFSVPF